MAEFRKAFTLSKAEVENATPPGTVTLIEHLERTASHEIQDELRLVPRPTADPADPLNFSTWRKAGILFSMSLCPFVANFTAGSLSSALPVYASTPALGLPPKPFSKLNQLIAINVLFLGAANLWWVPLANIFGRRPIMLLAFLLLIFSSMWAGLTSNFSSLLAARAFMGMGAGSVDTVSPVVLGETFFVHQRGRVMAIYTFCLGVGPVVGPIAGSYIVASGGLLWLHWTNVILSAFTFVVFFFLLPETLFDRPRGPPPQNPEKMHAEKIETVQTSTAVDSSSYQPYSFARSLKIFTTYRGDVLSNFTAPYKTIRLPGVWLVALWYAGLIAAVVTSSAVAAQIVSSPPYLWGKNAGLINVGGVIGTMLGCIYCYLLADWLTKRLAKKDRHGFSEPESRLVSALPSFIIAVTGTLLFGFVAENPTPKGWIGLQFGIGMICFGVMQAPSVGFNYIIESYQRLAGDCFVAITTSRAILAFAWTFFVGDWIEEAGFALPFGIFGMLLGVFGLLTIPYLLWGKRLRIATAAWV
ncbi:MFS general substrate transporter [Periconia macrospinosa]|uniref:MFS general substrate transporter n=1 Tax=Periconia macrospinosa TaxID=97972 RepID=A0A2V1D9T5_9PLEO|nr:MFS general substrate transporter [Periconia macrospinosa]